MLFRSLYEKYIFNTKDSCIRIVYHDNSILGRIPDDKIGVEDTITLSRENLSFYDGKNITFYYVKLDKSNLDINEEKKFMGLIKKIDNYILSIKK